MVLDPIPQSLPVHFFGSRPQPPTSPSYRVRQNSPSYTSKSPYLCTQKRHRHVHSKEPDICPQIFCQLLQGCAFFWGVVRHRETIGVPRLLLCRMQRKGVPPFLCILKKNIWARKRAVQKNRQCTNKSELNRQNTNISDNYSNQTDKNTNKTHQSE